MDNKGKWKYQDDNWGEKHMEYVIKEGRKTKTMVEKGDERLHLYI